MNGECVEVSTRQGHVLIRDSADATGLVLTLSVGQWRRFICGISHHQQGAPKLRMAET
jgi:hypothetical protein